MVGDLWARIGSQPELLAALIGALVGGLNSTTASGLVTWRQIAAQRQERQRSERRDAYLAYVEWLTNARGGEWLTDEERPVAEWNAGAIEIAAGIFGSELVQEGLDLVRGLRFSQWWGHDTGTQRPEASFVLQRNATADLVMRIAAQMEQEIRHGRDRDRADLRKAIDRLKAKVENETPPSLPPD